jgi:hypothetical protein
MEQITENIDQLLDVTVTEMGGDEDATGLAASSTCTSSTTCKIEL